MSRPWRIEFKAARDLMIYFLWQTGCFTNQKISELFGLSYSSVSRRIGIFRKKLRVDKTFKKKYDKCSVKNNLVEFAPEFAVDLIDLIEQNRSNSELFRGLLRMKIV